MNRRSFISRALGGIAAAIGLPLVVTAETTPKAACEQKMKWKRYGHLSCDREGDKIMRDEFEHSFKFQLLNSPVKDQRSYENYKGHVILYQRFDKDKTYENSIAATCNFLIDPLIRSKVLDSLVESCVSRVPKQFREYVRVSFSPITGNPDDKRIVRWAYKGGFNLCTLCEDYNGCPGFCQD